MSRVLVTGASGFVGQAVCQAFAAQGDHVIAGTRSGEDVLGADETWRLNDLGRSGPLEPWTSPPDAIIHLAARVHVMAETSADPLDEYRRVNVEGTRHLAETAEKCGVRRLVFLSTVKVNGEATAVHPFTNADTPHPNDPYGQSKWEAEQVLSDIASRGRLEVVVLRVPLVYGPGVKANFLSLLRLCDMPVPLPFGALTGNRRSLVYSHNLADAVVRAVTHTGAAGKTILVSDGAALSTADLVRSLRKGLGRPAWLFHLPPGLLRLVLSAIGKTSVAQRLIDSLEVDSSACATDLDWRAPCSVEDGLAATANWYRRRSDPQ